MASSPDGWSPKAEEDGGEDGGIVEELRYAKGERLLLFMATVPGGCKGVGNSRKLRC